MSDIIIFIVVGFAFIALIMFSIWGLMMLYKSMFKENAKKKEDKDTEEVPIKTNGEKVVYPYKLTQSIFSPKEGYFYRDVRPIADKLGLLVFTKMRLADLLYIPKGTADYQKWFNRIKAKHIDFILVDREMNIKLLVEVDDPTHNKPDRQARDEEVDEIFRQQGLEVLHLRAWGKQYGADDLETIITSALNVQKTAPGSEQQK